MVTNSNLITVVLIFFQVFSSSPSSPASSHLAVDGPLHSKCFINASQTKERLISIQDLLAELIEICLTTDDQKSGKQISLLPSWDLMRFGLHGRDDKWKLSSQVNQAQVKIGLLSRDDIMIDITSQLSVGHTLSPQSKQKLFVITSQKVSGKKRQKQHQST